VAMDWKGPLRQAFRGEDGLTIIGVIDDDAKTIQVKQGTSPVRMRAIEQRARQMFTKFYTVVLET